MDTIELKAIAHNGTVTVNLPELYRHAWNEKPVRVLLIKEDEVHPSKGSLLGSVDFLMSLIAYIKSHSSKR